VGLFDRLQKEIEIHEKGGGVTVADVLTLPEPQRKVMSMIIRRRLMTFDELIEVTKEDAEDLTKALAELVEMGYLLEADVSGVLQYKVIFSRKRGRKVPFNVWDTLGGRVEKE
jgi:hypothetical protein